MSQACRKIIVKFSYVTVEDIEVQGSNLLRANRW